MFCIFDATFARYPNIELYNSSSEQGPKITNDLRLSIQYLPNLR